MKIKFLLACVFAFLTCVNPVMAQDLSGKPAAKTNLLSYRILLLQGGYLLYSKYSVTSGGSVSGSNPYYSVKIVRRKGTKNVYDISVRFTVGDVLSSLKTKTKTVNFAGSVMFPEGNTNRIVFGDDYVLKVRIDPAS